MPLNQIMGDNRIEQFAYWYIKLSVDFLLGYMMIFTSKKFLKSGVMKQKGHRKNI